MSAVMLPTGSQGKSQELSRAFAALRPYFIRAAWLGGIAALLVLAPSVYMLEVYDRVVNSRNYMTLAMLTLAVLGVFVLMEALEWARDRVLHDAGHAFDKALGDRLFNAMFAANLRVPGAGTAQVMTDFRVLREFVASVPVKSLIEAPISLVLLGVIFLMHPVFGVLCLVGAILQVFIGFLNERATQPPLMAANRAAIAAQVYADGTLRNAQVIESMGMQRDIHKRWMEKQRAMLQLQALASDRAGSHQAVTRLLSTLMGSMIIGVGAWLFIIKDLPGGPSLLIVASILSSRVFAPLVSLISQWRVVVNARDAWARVENLLTLVPSRPDSMPLPPPRGLLAVENVVAAAPGSQQAIIRGAAFTLQPADVLVVVGPSAAGKTTLARLLVGLWPTASGKVRLDGVDVYSWDKLELGPHVGYLPQDVELFDGTVAENISRFGTVEMAKVESVTRLIGLHEFIMSLPKGYDTPVGPDGARLSGGQRQRVGLARALYGDPVLVVLDEPNSSLDEAGDAALSAAILEMKSRGTTFVINTHRLSILGAADKMLVLRDGQQQAFGPRDQVMAALAQATAQAQAQAAQAGSGAQAQQPAQAQLAPAT